MGTTNNRSFKLVLVDTCIVSEMLKRKDSLSKNVLSKTFDNKLLCFSIETLKELKSAPALYEEFMETFSYLPALILKDSSQLLRDEMRNYDKVKKINPVLTYLHRKLMNDTNIDIKKILDQYLTKEILGQYNEDKRTTLIDLLKLKEGYPPKNDKYMLKEIREFVEWVTLKDLAIRYGSWCQEKLDKKEAISVDKFPSIKSECFIIFYKFYLNNRKPKFSDIPDILMSSAYPYVDEIIIEKNQAEIIRQIQLKFNFCNHLKIFTINDFV